MLSRRYFPFFLTGVSVSKRLLYCFHMCCICMLLYICMLSTYAEHCSLYVFMSPVVRDGCLKIVLSNSSWKTNQSRKHCLATERVLELCVLMCLIQYVNLLCCDTSEFSNCSLLFAGEVTYCLFTSENAKQQNSFSHQCEIAGARRLATQWQLAGLVGELILLVSYLETC